MDPSTDSLLVSCNSPVASQTSQIKHEAEALIPQLPANGSSSGDSTVHSSLKWGTWYRRYITVLACVILFLTVSLTSEALSVFARPLAVEYRMADTVISLAISSFSVTYCLGPLLWSPLSEQYGRRPILLLSFNCLAVLQVCAAASQNAASIAIFRLLAGFFGSACISIAPAIVADIWEFEVRERETGTYALNSMSPSSAILGLALAREGIDWRGTCWVLSVITGFCTILVILTFRETRPRSTIQANKFANDVSSSSQERVAVNEQSLLQTLTKPYVLLYHGPLLAASTVYMGLVAASVNIFLKIAAIGFQPYSPPVQILASSMVLLGCILGLLLHNVLIYPRFYLPRARELASERVPPEVRLSLAIWAAPLFALSLFWFGWTLSPSISIVVPLLACLALGLSALWIMQAMLNYVIDIYRDSVATALSWYIVVTYIFVTIFTVYEDKAMRALGTCWVSTLAGCVAVSIIPVPILLSRYGPALRAKSRCKW